MLSYLLNELRNFNEIFMKDVAYDNIKSHKKTGLQPLFRKHIFEKSQGGATRGGGGGGGAQIDPLPFSGKF